MAKEIILYNLRGDVSEEDYLKWCETYKGPLLLGLQGTRSFTLVKLLGGMKGNGEAGSPPVPSASPYKYIGILDAASQEDWDKARESKEFKKEFFPQWFSRWVADFYVLGGADVYHGENS